MPYTYTVNGESFTTARKAVKACILLTMKKEKIKTIRINGEPMMFSELEAAANLERMEAQHNKQQGL